MQQRDVVAEAEEEFVNLAAEQGSGHEGSKSSTDFMGNCVDNDMVCSGDFGYRYGVVYLKTHTIIRAMLRIRLTISAIINSLFAGGV